MTSSFTKTFIQVSYDPKPYLFESCATDNDCGTEGLCYTPYKDIIEPYICK